LNDRVNPVFDALPERIVTQESALFALRILLEEVVATEVGEGIGSI